MGKRKRLTMIALVFFGVALIAAGAASAATGVVGDDPTDPTETTQSTEAPLPLDTTDETLPTDTTDTTAVTEETPDAEEDTEEGTFGAIISALRQAGDHTPAAIIMGKEVPGWDPDKHPGSTTDITAYPPGQMHDGDDDGDDDGDEEAEEEDSADGSGDKHKAKSNNGHGQKK